MVPSMYLSNSIRFNYIVFGVFNECTTCSKKQCLRSLPTDCYSNRAHFNTSHTCWISARPPMQHVVSISFSIVATESSTIPLWSSVPSLFVIVSWSIYTLFDFFAFSCVAQKSTQLFAHFFCDIFVVRDIFLNNFSHFHIMFQPTVDQELFRCLLCCYE